MNGTHLPTVRLHIMKSKATLLITLVLDKHTHKKKSKMGFSSTQSLLPNT